MDILHEKNMTYTLRLRWSKSFRIRCFLSPRIHRRSTLHSLTQRLSVTVYTKHNFDIIDVILLMPSNMKTLRICSESRIFCSSAVVTVGQCLVLRRLVVSPCT